jgi:hypothetical protein
MAKLHAVLLASFGTSSKYIRTGERNLLQLDMRAGTVPGTLRDSSLLLFNRS